MGGEYIKNKRAISTYLFAKCDNSDFKRCVATPSYLCLYGYLCLICLDTIHRKVVCDIVTRFFLEWGSRCFWFGLLWNSSVFLWPLWLPCGALLLPPNGGECRPFHRNWDVFSRMLYIIYILTSFYPDTIHQ